MMKATVLNSQDGKSVVLAEDGRFCNISGSYPVGSVIDHAEKPKHPLCTRRNIRRMVRAAACILVAFVISFYSYSYLTVYAKVTFDGSPKIEYSLNREGEILNVKALDDDQQSTVDKLIRSGVRGKDLGQAAVLAEKVTGSGHRDDSGRPKISCKDPKKARELKKKTDSFQKQKTKKKQHGEVRDRNMKKRNSKKFSR